MRRVGLAAAGVSCDGGTLCKDPRPRVAKNNEQENRDLGLKPQGSHSTNRLNEPGAGSAPDPVERSTALPSGP